MTEHPMRDPQLDLVLRGGTVVTVEGQRAADVGIRDGRVAVIQDRDQAGGATLSGAREIDASGRLLLPGGVDPHVHLHTEGTDPGEPTWVDDYTSGSWEESTCGGDHNTWRPDYSRNADRSESHSTRESGIQHGGIKHAP